MKLRNGLRFLELPEGMAEPHRIWLLSIRLGESWDTLPQVMPFFDECEARSVCEELSKGAPDSVKLLGPFVRE